MAERLDAACKQLAAASKKPDAAAAMAKTEEAAPLVFEPQSLTVEMLGKKV